MGFVDRQAVVGVHRSQQAATGSSLHGIALGDGKVFFNEDDDYIVALNAKTGQLAWRVGPNGESDRR